VYFVSQDINVITRGGENKFKKRSDGDIGVRVYVDAKFKVEGERDFRFVHRKRVVTGRFTCVCHVMFHFMLGGYGENDVLRIVMRVDKIEFDGRRRGQSHHEHFMRVNDDKVGRVVMTI